MNNNERLYNIEDTLKYLTDKMDKDMRWIKNALKFVINLTKPKKCNCNNECNDCVCNHEEEQPHFWNT